MADITNELAAWMNAQYGEDVREAQVSLSNKINDEVEDNTTTVNAISASETSRVSAENARVAAEKLRVTAENARASAESSRATAESGRVSAENSRVVAESSRVVASATAINNARFATGQAQDAASQANDAASSATTAAGNATTAAGLATSAATSANTAAQNVDGKLTEVNDFIINVQTKVDNGDFNGDQGEPGEPLKASIVYETVADMNAGYATDGVAIGGFAAIASDDTSDTDVGSFYVKTDTSYIFFVDMSDISTGYSVPVTFTVDSGTDNIASGNSPITIFGKVAAWFNRLRSAAFMDSTTDLDTDAEGFVLDARAGKTLSDNQSTTNQNVTALNNSLSALSTTFGNMQIGVTNLIQDSDFSQFRAGRGTWSTAIGISATIEPGNDPSYFHRNSIVATITGRENLTGRYSAAYQEPYMVGYPGRIQVVQPNEIISFGAWVKVRSDVPYVSGGSIYVRFGSAESGGTTKDVNLPLDGVPKDTWTFLSTSVNIGVCVYQIVTSVALINGSVEIDMPMLVRGTIVPDHLPSPLDAVSKVEYMHGDNNLILNSDFALGGTSWACSGGGQLAIVDMPGAKPKELQDVTVCMTNSQFAYQQMDLELNTYYTVSVWMYATADTASNVKIQAWYSSGGWGGIGVVTRTEKGAWVKLTYTFKSHATYNRHVIGFGSDGVTSLNKVFVALPKLQIGKIATPIKQNAMDLYRATKLVNEKIDANDITRYTATTTVSGTDVLPIYDGAHEKISFDNLANAFMAKFFGSFGIPLIQRGTITVTPDTLGVTKTTAITFPKAFTATPYIIPVLQNGAVDIGVGYDNPTTKGFDLYLWRSKSLNDTKINWTAIQLQSGVTQSNYVGTFAGKTLVNLGDSINQGYGNGGQTAGVSYVDMIATDYKMDNRKYATYGAKMASVGTNTLESQLNQLIAAAVTPDLIIINGGTNDIPNPANSTTYSALGTISGVFTGGYDRTTVIGAMEYIFLTLKTKFPASKIIYVRVHNMSTRKYADQVTYGEAAEKVCSKWGVPVCNIFRDGTFNTNIPTITSKYGGDGTHPNGAAYEEFYVPLLKETMQKL